LTAAFLFFAFLFAAAKNKAAAKAPHSTRKSTRNPEDFAMPAESPPAPKPQWNHKAHELRLENARFELFAEKAAPVLMGILDAFQKAGWPDESIPCPLPDDGEPKSKTRLHDALKRLNGILERHGAPLRFHGDGSGMGATWAIHVSAKKREKEG
jgi:hypothetical protein